MDTTCHKVPIDPLASQSFYLAIFFLLLPIHADFLNSVATQKNGSIILAISVSAFFIGLVSIPTVISAKRVFFKARKFRGKRYLYPTFVLILLNLFISVWTINSMRLEPIHQNLNKHTQVGVQVNDKTKPERGDGALKGIEEFDRLKPNPPPASTGEDGKPPEAIQPPH